MSFSINNRYYISLKSLSPVLKNTSPSSNRLLPLEGGSWERKTYTYLQQKWWNAGFFPSETSNQDTHVNLPGIPNAKVTLEVLKFKKKSDESEVLPTWYQTLLLVQFCTQQFICPEYIYFFTLSLNCCIANVCQLAHEVKYT